MKYNCELIQDLLPLYEEGLCSPTSRQIVEQHLFECEDCRRLTMPLPIQEPQETPAADRAVKKSIKKVRRQWLTSLVAALLAVPMLLMTWNQYRGSGLCFTNLDEVYTAWRFLHALEVQDWETAASMHDYSSAYSSILEALGQDEASFLVRHSPFRLAGYDYVAKTYLSDMDAVPESVQDLYGYLYNQTGSAMVPAELWDQLLALDPAAFSVDHWRYWLNGVAYGKITTPWGEFVVNDGLSYPTAFDYALHFDLIPSAIYAEARPGLEAESHRLYAATQKSVGWVAELTESEFSQEMTQRYLSDLQTLTDNVTFDGASLQDADHHGDGDWYVAFAVTVTQGQNVLDTKITISVRDGKVRTASISYEPGTRWLDAIDRALYPSAHPGY